MSLPDVLFRTQTCAFYFRNIKSKFITHTPVCNIVKVMLHVSIWAII